MTLRPAYDFAQQLAGYDIVNATLGPRNEVCILAVESGSGFRELENPTNHEFAYRIIITDDNGVRKLDFPRLKMEYDFVQPLQNERILLVSARSNWYAAKKYDLNAAVFERDGTFVRNFLLGDGIQDMYVTDQDIIWTSYFDEGIFGNNGWEEPVGIRGLKAWDTEGKEVFTYPRSIIHSMEDCYALNVVADEDIWFYYYMEFALARYHNGELFYYKPGVKGADGFTLFEDYALFRGGYDSPEKFILYHFRNKYEMRKKCFIQFLTEDEEVIDPHIVANRGSVFLFTVDTSIYLVRLEDVVEEVNK